MTDARRNNSPSPVAPPAGGLREVAETVVFVVVLVLLLKTFVAEAFVIPTGSMATTLWGDQKEVTCPECDFNFPVNCSTEHDEERKSDNNKVIGCICPNCRYRIQFKEFKDPPACRTGDRVMVAKFLYDLSLDDIDRNDVVVFKYPETPQKNFS